MKTRHQYSRQKECEENILHQIHKSIPESRCRDKEINISREVTSTQMEEYFPAKHIINNEDLNLMVKNFIRLALALEHTRTPIKREDIMKKVILPSHSRSFIIVFEKTQEKLRNIFGMELVELPYKNRFKHMSASQLRRSQNSKIHLLSSTSHSNKSWILCSILDSKYANLVSQVPTIKEGIFSGVVMIILSLVIMSGGVISEEHLIKYLSHLHINNDTPIGNLDKTLKEIIKKGYLERIKDDATSLNEEEKGYTYFLGPRGKTEINPEKLTTFIEKIQGSTTQNLKKIVEKLFNKSISNEPYN